MATVSTLLNRAVRLVASLPSNTSLGTNEAADALVALNARLDTWRNEGLMCYAEQEESLTLSASTTSYTIGPSGTLNTVRPVEIVRAWIVASNISYGVRLISDEEYAAIPDKTSTADWPDRVNYKASMATGTLYCYPVPNATRTLKLLTRVVVSAYSATTDTVTLPPGWEQALTTQVAIDLAPEYQTQASQELVAMARAAKAGIMVANSKAIRANSGLVGLLRGGHSNIFIGSP